MTTITPVIHGRIKPLAHGGGDSLKRGERSSAKTIQLQCRRETFPCVWGDQIRHGATSPDVPWIHPWINPVIRLDGTLKHAYISAHTQTHIGLRIPYASAAALLARDTK